MKRTLSLGLVWLAAALVPGAACAQDFSDVEIEAQHVAGNVYMLVGRGGNIGVSSGPDGALIVDDQFAPLADKIRAALREIGTDAAAADLQFVLNTHWHGDHTGGNVEFGPEATIVAHANVRKRLATSWDRGGGRMTEAQPPEALPVITFGDSLSIHFNGEEIRAIHLGRGHTDGDAVIFFTGANVVHMGDNFFAGRFPFVDLDSNGSVRGLERAVTAVLAQIPDDAHVIPGHGPLSSVEDLRLYQRMLRESIALVAGKIEAGASLERVRSEGVADQWDGWGEGFISTERWLETVYQSLTGDGTGEGARAVPVRGAADPAHGGNYDRPERPRDGGSRPDHDRGGEQS